MPEIRLREFHFSQDYESARRLWESSGPGIRIGRSDEPEEILKKLQRDPDLFLVAEQDGELLGTVIGGFDGRRGMVYHLAVKTEQRGRGIGKQLMNEVERRLKSKGCVKYYLMVVCDNPDAMRFYEQLGWKRMDHVYTYGKELP